MLQVRRFARATLLGGAPFWRRAHEPARGVAGDAIQYALRDHQMAVRVLPAACVEGPRVRQLAAIGQGRPVLGKSFDELDLISQRQLTRERKFELHKQPAIGSLVAVGCLPVGQRRIQPAHGLGVGGAAGFARPRRHMAGHGREHGVPQRAARSTLILVQPTDVPRLCAGALPTRARARVQVQVVNGHDNCARRYGIGYLVLSGLEPRPHGVSA